ncbi:MAG: transcription-repair coupling factor [Acidimicrobiaceae bacterium]|nr:transcription-repair coupling factor [Acidimicrobiaceae bacterium]
MHFRSLFGPLSRTPSFEKVNSSPSGSFYLPGSAASFILGAMHQTKEIGHIVAVVATRQQAADLAEELLEIMEPNQVRLFPSWETLPLERVSPSIETMGLRLKVLNELNDQAASADRLVIVAPVRAMCQLVGSSAISAGFKRIELGMTLSPEDLVTWLSYSGYRREYQVEHRGEFAVRGSIVDVFPSHADSPVRADFFGDEIDRLSIFDPSEQLSLETTNNVAIYPARELLVSQYVKEQATLLLRDDSYAQSTWEKIARGQFFEGMESWLPWVDKPAKNVGEFLGPNTNVILFEPARLRARVSDLLQEEASIVEVLSSTWMVPGDHAAFPGLFMELENVLAFAKGTVRFANLLPDPSVRTEISAIGVDLSSKDPGVIVARLSQLLKDRYSVFICAANEALAARLVVSLGESGLSPTLVLSQEHLDALLQRSHPGLFVTVSGLDRGTIFPEMKLAVIGQGDLTNKRRSRRPARTMNRGSAQVFDALKVGGYVVHNHHGVGRFAGMVKQELGGVERDYLLIEYRGDDRLYIPSDQMESIMPYLGGEAPALSKLGGMEWQKTRSRVRQAVSRIAQELVVLYQKRIITKGFAFSPDTVWQKEMEDLFPYDLTPDQARAIADVKADMEIERPMDRLICGDVGFGKTEVAIRAVFKAVQDGKQAAVLVPTTLLAQQHLQTFSDRFSAFPVRVEVISRFLTPAQNRDVLQRVADGSTDVIIGTHRLLSQDVTFADLGLLVVDEEQHFGVTHKESIKKIKAGIDVLTLTATPIPRTLEMSLTGIRDMSLLSTPPTQRQPILTYVGEYDELAVSEALRRELMREGQIFFVHNRVSDIDQVAQGLSMLVPEARITIAHGQMDEGTLEQTVVDFWEGRYDVLVCTTIIESGIDMPTVNTLVVDRADLLGLGQLHQLRGRVGRSGTRGYAYLFHPADVVLSEDAYERLKTIGENTELGSGFRIAKRDLEIRGAGNILGDDQSGHIAAVGYDLYVKMVEEAVRELKGEIEPSMPDIKLEIPVGAVIPEGYISRTDLRLEAYRRLSMCTSNDDVDQVAREWHDRFGPIPNETKSLLRLAKIRARAIHAQIKEVTVAGMGRSSLVSPSVRLSPVELKASVSMRMKRLFPKGLYKEREKMVIIPISKGSDLMEALEHVFDELIDV